MAETIFDEINFTTKECRDGLHNLLESVLNGHTIEEPRYETALNQMATYMIRTVERA